MANSTKGDVRLGRCAPGPRNAAATHRRRGGRQGQAGEGKVNVTHSKTGRADAASPSAAVAPLPPPSDTPERESPPRPGPPDGFEEPRALGSVLDDALARMERRARGEERPVPLPWSNVAAALGGGLWGGTLVTLV